MLIVLKYLTRFLQNIAKCKPLMTPYTSGETAIIVEIKKVHAKESILLYGVMKVNINRPSRNVIHQSGITA